MNAILPISPVHEMEWRVCPRFSQYEVSEWGDIRRVVGSPTRQVGHRYRGYINGDGYLAYHLTNDDGEKQPVTAHRLVAEAFIGPAPSEMHEVAHNNGSRVCAYFRELRWALRVENHADMMVHGTSPAVGERNPKAKLTEADVRAIRREYRLIKDSRGRRKVTELEDRYGLHRATVVAIARGRSWKHVPMEAFR